MTQLDPKIRAALIASIGLPRGLRDVVALLISAPGHRLRRSDICTLLGGRDRSLLHRQLHHDAAADVVELCDEWVSIRRDLAPVEWASWASDRGILVDPTVNEAPNLVDPTVNEAPNLVDPTVNDRCPKQAPYTLYKNLVVVEGGAQARASSPAGRLRFQIRFEQALGLPLSDKIAGYDEWETFDRATAEWSDLQIDSLLFAWRDCDDPQVLAMRKGSLRVPWALDRHFEPLTDLARSAVGLRDSLSSELRAAIGEDDAAWLTEQLGAELLVAMDRHRRSQGAAVRDYSRSLAARCRELGSEPAALLERLQESLLGKFNDWRLAG